MLCSHILGCSVDIIQILTAQIKDFALKLFSAAKIISFSSKQINGPTSQLLFK